MINKTDARLLEGFARGLNGIRGMTLSGKAAAIRDLAARVLEEGNSELKTAVEQEDREEVESLEARRELQRERAGMDEAFTRLYLALHGGILQRRLAGDPGQDAKELMGYLSSQNPSLFASATLATGLSALKRARAFADRYVPDNYREAVTAFVDSAVERVETAKAKYETEEVEAIQSLANLEKARQRATEKYLTARDLVSAAMRDSGQLDKIGQVLPPLRDVLSPGGWARTSGSGDQPESVSPTAEAEATANAEPSAGAAKVAANAEPSAGAAEANAKPSAAEAADATAGGEKE